MGMPTENIVQGGAMRMQEEKRLTAEESDNVMSFRLAMSMADDMLEKGIISETEHRQIEQKMGEKYCIKITSVFRIICRKSLDNYPGKS